MLLILRQSANSLQVPGWSFFPSLLHDPTIVEGALRFLDGPPTTFVSWGQPAAQTVYRTCVAIARRAQRLAERLGLCDPDNAWVGGLLAPLGWLAVCAVDADQAVACLVDPDLGRHPATVQHRCWGLDQTAIARRLTRRWGLPAWLSGVIGHLGLRADVAQSLGADPHLLRVVQLAVSLAQKPDRTLHLPTGAAPAEMAAALGLPAHELEALEQEVVRQEADTSALVWESPAGNPLLRELLILAAENRRLRGGTALARLESELDDLHRALEDQCSAETERLQQRKLSALAEFAAGAGHEINNPLAVISGQAQYLLKQLHLAERRLPAESERESNLDEDESPFGQLQATIASSCQAIIDQTQRVHRILRDLWQFARPPQPRKQPVDLPELIQEVGAALRGLADERRVQLRLDRAENGTNGVGAPHPLTVLADPGQLRTALTCLVRNAIEAAPADGWAQVRLETPQPNQVEVLVEDSGIPPGLSQREHLFDPFYSGRQAGRGKGLGLPTAWRLARAHGGDVRFAGQPGEPTRFILSLPCESGSNGKQGAVEDREEA